MNYYKAIQKAQNYSAQADRIEKRARRSGKNSKEWATYEHYCLEYLKYSELAQTLKTK